jgi:hypothetical protein
MLDEKDLMLALKRHWDYVGRDEDIAHEIYHDDAVLEFPQSGERFEGIENFREWRRQHPAHLRMHPRRNTHRDDLVVGPMPRLPGRTAASGVGRAPGRLPVTRTVV